MTGFKIYSDRDGALWIRSGKKVRFLCNCCSLAEIGKQSGRPFKDSRGEWGLTRVAPSPKAPAFETVRHAGTGDTWIRRIEDGRVTFLFSAWSPASEPFGFTHADAPFVPQTDSTQFKVTKGGKIRRLSDGKTCVLPSLDELPYDQTGRVTWE